jgi:hypothetical protein
MTATIQSSYPTADTIVLKIKQFISSNDVIVSDWDDFVYEFISDEYDNQFASDPNWFDEDDTDEKDALRDEVIELLGVE